MVKEKEIKKIAEKIAKRIQAGKNYPLRFLRLGQTGTEQRR